MSWLAWLLIGYFALNALADIALVGRPRKAITATEAVCAVVGYVGYIWAVVALAT